MSLNGTEVKSDSTITSRGEVGFLWENNHKYKSHPLKLSIESSIIHEFNGKAEARISGIGAEHDSGGTWGRLGLNVALHTSDTTRAYIRAHGLVGSDRSGGGVLFGFAKKF